MSTRPTQEQIKALRDRYNWRQVAAPKAWRPKPAGDELVGFYGGKTQRNGSYGPYEVVIVHVPARGALLVSGVQAIQLIDASGADVGSPIRFVFKGTTLLEEGRKMKEFDLFISDDQQPLAAEYLPQVQESQ